MSIIQRIRDKYIGVVIVAIVLGLVGFLVMDAIHSNLSNLFGDKTTSIAKVNGTDLEYADYQTRLQATEEGVKAQNPTATLGEEFKSQLGEQVYNSMVQDVLLKGEYEKLGLNVSDAEIRDMTTGPNPHPSVRQSFTNPQTGVFDPQMVVYYINTLNQKKDPKEKAKWNEFIDNIVQERLSSKYTGMLTGGVYVPKFVLAEMHQNRGTQSAISYVQVPYATIADDQVKVTDEDIKGFMQKHKEQFEQDQETRKVEYVSFDIVPSKEDSVKVLGALEAAKGELAATTDVENFVNRNSDQKFDGGYYTKQRLQSAIGDTLMNLPVGVVYGPYFEKGAFSIVKVIDRKSLADSAKASHILIAVNENISDTVAKTRIDSVEKAIRGGASFAALAQQYSDDPGSKEKGGELGTFPQGMMVAEFNDAVFNGKAGDLKVVKTQFGYHLIKIEELKSFLPAVKLAMVSKSFSASQETENAAYAAASDFAAKNRDAKAFQAATKTMNKRVADNITDVQSAVQGLGLAREMVRWAFQSEKGAVSSPIALDGRFIVASMTEVHPKGLVSVDAVRPQLETFIRKEKKAKLIGDKMKGASLQDIAQKNGGTVLTADSLNFMGGFTSALGYEPKVIGASFNKANVNKVSEPIPGEAGVFAVTIRNLTDMTKEMPATEEFDRMQAEGALKGNISNGMIMSLRKAAEIKDNRAKFF